MKGVTEKALGNGFDPYRETLNRFEKHYNIKSAVAKIEESEGFIFIEYTQNGQPSNLCDIETPSISYMENIYQLIFATDFIDKLVGEEPPVNCYILPTVCTDEKLISNLCVYPTGNRCKCFRGWLDANYHRAQMANMKDVEKLKEYVRGLI